MATRDTQGDALDTAPRRRIGTVGTAARVALGAVLVGSVIWGHLGAFRWPPWAAGLVVFPAITLGGQWLRTRIAPGRLHAIGPVPHVANVAAFFALYLTPWYVPALSFTSDGALLFYGTSMILAAVRGYAGCEVLAISNWLLRRDDQAGCLLFAPIDRLDGRRSAR